MTGRTDAELTATLAAGDTSAWGHLFDRHRDHVWQVAYDSLRQRSAADDVVRATFLDAVDSIDQLTDPDGLRPWLLSMARGRASDMARRIDAAPDSEERTSTEDGGGMSAVAAEQSRAATLEAAAGTPLGPSGEPFWPAERRFRRDDGPGRSTRTWPGLVAKVAALVAVAAVGAGIAVAVDGADPPLGVERQIGAGAVSTEALGVVASAPAGHWPACHAGSGSATSAAVDRGPDGTPERESWDDRVMTTDLTIEMADTAGELARLGLAFGVAGINIEGLCAVTHGGPTALIHVLVDDAEGAYEALAAAGIEVQSDSEVLVVEVDDHPGVLGEIAERLGEAGINIELIYLATATRLVIGADDLHQARLVLDEG